MCTSIGKGWARTSAAGLTRLYSVAGHRWKWWSFRIVLEQLDACIKRDAIWGWCKLSMFSRCDCSGLTEARSPKTGDAAEKAEGDSLGDDCIPVYLNSCLTYRCKDVPTSWQTRSAARSTSKSQSLLLRTRGRLRFDAFTRRSMISIWKCSCKCLTLNLRFRKRASKRIETKRQVNKRMCVSGYLFDFVKTKFWRVCWCVAVPGRLKLVPHDDRKRPLETSYARRLFWRDKASWRTTRPRTTSIRFFYVISSSRAWWSYSRQM